jgi:hypothetical protein
MRAVVLVLLVGCTAASSDPALDALLQVKGAQFRPGPFPAETGGPAALAVTTRHAEITIGELREPVRGVLEPAARGAVIGIDGVDGTWLLPAGPADLDTPGQATAKATIGVSDGMPAGPFMLRLAASDAQGRFGTSTTTMVIANEAVEPQGELVFGLHWDGAADLDLHVVAPDGEAFSDDPNTWTPPPPGEPVDPEAWKAGGVLDHDGNQACHRDARPNEHVVWTMPPMPGEYVIRVDARSLCGDAIAAWRLEAYGALTGEARGVSTSDDVQQPNHGYGAGVLALRLTIP